MKFLLSTAALAAVASTGMSDEVFVVSDNNNFPDVRDIPFLFTSPIAVDEASADDAGEEASVVYYYSDNAGPNVDGDDNGYGSQYIKNPAGNDLPPQDDASSSVTIGYSDSSLNHEASDASVASAENAFMVTPHSADYQEAVNEAFAAVRVNCAQDYLDYCGAPPEMGLAESVVSLLANNFFTSFFTPSVAFSVGSGGRRRLFDSALHSFPRLVGMKERMGDMASQFAAFRGQFKSSPSAAVGVQGSLDTAAGAPVSQSINDVPAVRSNVLSRGEMAPAAARLMRMNTQQQQGQKLRGNVRLLKDVAPPMPMDKKPCPYHDHDGDHHDHDHDGSGGKHHHHDEDEHGPPPPPPPQDEDYLYTGEMLWGPDGDACMYDNFKSLSTECQGAIGDVFELRQDYWREETDNHGPPHVFFLILLATMIGIFACKKRKMMKARRERDIAVYNALLANPKMKAELEAASGVTFDAPAPQKSCGFFFCRMVACALVGIVVVHIAAFVAMLVAESMKHVDEDGEEHYPNPLIPLATFVVTVLALLSLVMTCVRGCRPRRNHTEGGAAVATATATVGPAPYYGFRMPTVFSCPFTSTATTTTSAGSYTALANESQHPVMASATGDGHEMVTIHRVAQPQPTVVLTAYPSTATCVTPMTII